LIIGNEERKYRIGRDFDDRQKIDAEKSKKETALGICNYCGKPILERITADLACCTNTAIVTRMMNSIKKWQDKNDNQVKN